MKKVLFTLLLVISYSGIVSSQSKTISDIEVVEVEKINSTNDGYYSVTLDIKYIGGSFLTSLIEQEGVTSLIRKETNEPDSARVTYSNLRKGRLSWIYLTAYSGNESKAYTYEVTPLASSDISSDEVDVISSKYKIYTIEGRYIGCLLIGKTK